MKVFLSGYLQEFCLDKKIPTPREPEKLSFAIKQAKVTHVAELGKRHLHKKVGPVAKLDNPPREPPAQTSSASSSPCPPHQPGGSHDDDDGEYDDDDDDDDGDYDDDGDNGGDDDDIDEGGLHPHVHLLSLQVR